LYSDRIQTIVQSRNNDNFDEIAETALEEKSAIISKQERYKGEAGTPVKCGNCGKLGHHTQSCFKKKKFQISQAKVEKASTNFEVTCYNCRMKGHYARNCPKIMRKFDRRDNRQERSGNENRVSENSSQTVNSTH
jgi:hypothetical protein